MNGNIYDLLLDAKLFMLNKSTENITYVFRMYVLTFGFVIYRLQMIDHTNYIFIN